MSTYSCSKCPDPILNGFLVMFIMLISFLYLLVLVITTIRKKKENQTSIMLKIMTNYLQLVAAIYSFNMNFPTGLLNMFGSMDIIGSSSDAFLSFDCFIEDSQMKWVMPSNEVFKVFLTIFLPIVLILIYLTIWTILYFISPSRFGEWKRYVVISIICTLFLLHPNIAKQSLGMFECVEVGGGERRFRMHMDYL